MAVDGNPTVQMVLPMAHSKDPATRRIARAASAAA